LVNKGYNTVLLTVSSSVGLSNIEVSVPVSYLVLHRHPSSCENDGLNRDTPVQATAIRQKLLEHAGFRVNENIFVLGQPRAFPNDWYELEDSVAAYATRVNKNAAIVSSSKYPAEKLSSSLLIMSRDEDLSMQVGLDDSSAATNRDFKHPLMFTISRPGWIIFYTYWVAAMPFMLLITLGWYQCIVKKNVPKAYEVAFGIAATMVAILPLRAVLVPSSLPNLTRLDIVFSTEVALLVALSIVAVVVYSRDRDDTADGGGVDCRGRPATRRRCRRRTPARRQP
jgi:hypothetical protein